MNDVRLKTFVATRNLGKIGEFRELFAGTEIDLDTYPLYAAPEEGETSYADNAALKARRLHEQLKQAGVRGAVVADDSGLEVAALGGKPGVLSSRYGGPDATWGSRREKILAELSALPNADRSAKFACAMTLVFEDGKEIASFGEVEGVIAAEESGAFGFGYDPIFFYPPAKMTFAEMPEEQKNGVSHRGRAAAALLDALRSRV